MLKKIRFKNRIQGFTLIELLIVISIISILSVVGSVIFTGIQDKAKDSKRKQDISAIAKALEGRYQSSGYTDVTDDDFAGGKIPTPPEGGEYTRLFSGTGFRVCATLEEGTPGCSSSATQACYCLDSSQSPYVESSPSPSPSSEPQPTPNQCPNSTWQ